MYVPLPVGHGLLHGGDEALPVGAAPDHVGERLRKVCLQLFTGGLCGHVLLGSGLLLPGRRLTDGLFGGHLPGALVLFCFLLVHVATFVFFVTIHIKQFSGN